MDVVVDGLSVAQSRIDPKLGSQDLQAFTTFTSGFSGMIGYLLGGIVTQAGYARESFFIVGVIALLINLSACFLDKKFETMEKILKMSFCERTSFNFDMIKQAFQIKELRNFLIYYAIQGAIIPRYEEYVYYYLTDESEMGFSKMTYAYLKLASFFGVFLGAGCYIFFLKNLPIRAAMALACVVNAVSSMG